MKDFVKMTLAVITGLLIVSVFSMFLFVGMIGSLAIAGSANTKLPSNMVLDIDMSRITVSEQTEGINPLLAIQGQSGETIGIWDAVQAINNAADDPAVSFILLRTDGSLTGLATTQELRKALYNFRTGSGKPIISYIESPTSGSYYLASVADKVYMTAHPGATIMFNGVSTQTFFLGDLLKKLGVNVQLIRHGKYKSAGEMYTRASSSPENREQYQRLVDSMWEGISQETAASRSMSEKELNDAVDGLKLCMPEDFLAHGLVDELLTRDQLEEKITTLSGQSSYKNINLVDLKNYSESRKVMSKDDRKIAVIYANGNIVDGTEPQDIAGDRFARIISKIRADEKVKAVVLRVNSPGGSVLASDKIKHEMDLLCQEKPVVASYGEYAASGGYWISNGCRKIFSNKGTLTGSIGVFGIIPDFSKTARDVAHVGVESTCSNKHGDMYGMMRPFDKEEYDYMLRSIEGIYDKFTSMVAEGRGMTQEDVDKIGQGRVWTGADALNIGLVDEIGTLEDAVKYAAELAGDDDLSCWNICAYPKPLDDMSKILMMVSKKKDIDEDLVKAGLRKLSKPQVVARMSDDIIIK